ncbi:MAG: OmpA family protein [Paucibacter sp.]|nr:OmpA family protein [Roseateles sp.]
MKKLNRVASLFALAVLAASGAQAQQTIDNWRATDGTVWKNGTNELCWRDTFWTPATAAVGCDGAPAPAPAPAPVVAPPPPPAPPVEAPKPPPPPPAPVAVTEKITYGADALFDFDKAVLKPEGIAKLDELVSKLSKVTLEVIIAVGHTDSVGTAAYNQKLSVRRSEAVKAYLVSKGIEKNRIYTEGKGKTQPVADNKTAEGRAKNRRVEIEVVGTHTVMK